MERRNRIIFGVLLAIVAAAAGIAQLVQHGLVAYRDESIGIFDVTRDTRHRAWFDITFDRPVGVAQPGQVVIPPPATLDPQVPGVWRWRANNILRFEAAGGFTPGAEYLVKLNTRRFLGVDQRFRGDGELHVRIDDFIVAKFETTETAVDAQRHLVAINGRIEFNYPVNAETLVDRVEVLDGDRRLPVQWLNNYGCGQRTVEFVTPNIEKTKDARTLRIVVPKGVASCVNGAVLRDEFVQQVPLASIATLSVREVTPKPAADDSSLRIVFSAAVSPDVAAKYIRLTPGVKYHIASEGNALLLTGGFAPGSTYKLTVAKGFPSVDDATLPDDYTSDVVFDDLESRVDFQSGGAFLSASGYRTVAITSTNATEAILTIDRVYRNNIPFQLTHPYGGYDFDSDDEEGDSAESDDQARNIYGVSRFVGDRIAVRKLTLPKRRNRIDTTTISLERYVNKSEPGLYKVTISAKHRDATRWILITDIGAVVKRADDELLVWCASFKDLAPVANAQVALISRQNQTLASGRTDDRGMWRIPNLRKVLGKKQPLIITMQKGGDYSFLNLDDTRIDTSSFDTWGDKVPAGGYSAYLYGERDIYRPGEVVDGIAIVRDRMLAVPPKMPLVAKHSDAIGERESVRLTLSNGVAPFHLQLPAYARTGRHRIDLVAGKDVIGTYSFQVEEFVPDRIKVEVLPAKKNAATGDDLVYDVTSAYLFGPPAANLGVETRVRLTAVDFTPEGFDEFTFANAERTFDARELAKAEDTLDANGTHRFTFAVPPHLEVPASLEAIVFARVQEQGGRGVSAVAHIPIHPYPYYLGLRKLANKTSAFEWVAVSPDGTPVKSGTLRAELYFDRWNTVLRQVGNHYEYVSTRFPEQLSVRTLAAGEARGTFTFTPTNRGGGVYRVVLTDPATGASTEVEVADDDDGGSRYSAWAMKNPGRLELALDKEEYAPGDNAILAIKAPFAGKLLVTLERDDIHYTAVETLTGNSGRITIPVPAALRPNGYVTATLVRSAGDIEPGEAGRAFGAIPINVDRGVNHVNPKITAPADLRSNHTLPVEIETEPHALVTVAAVDEGILQLISQTTPDPFLTFYRKLALGTSTYDIFALLLPEVKPKGKAAAGGSESGEGMAQYVRADSIRRAKPVAYWSGVLEADARGHVKTSFTIPDFQGGVRIMAVAHRGRHFGSSESRVRVHDPLAILPTAPRFLSTGDQVSIPITVRNDTTRGGSFAVDLNGADRQRVDIPAKGERTVYFPVTAPRVEGSIVCTVNATGNGEKATARFDVPVRFDLPAESIEAAGAFRERATAFTDDLVTPFIPSTLERSLVISPLPLIRFRGKLSYLLHYPYGCVEQTTSSVFPLVYFSDLAKELDPDAFKRDDSAAMIHEGIRRLGTMQTYNGGFSMWPYGTSVHPWGSTYATHFLVEARRAGHPVDGQLYDRAIAYIANDAKARSAYADEDLGRVVYDLYVLGRAGKPDVGTMDYIRDHHASRLHPESRALLAAAYASAGNAQAIDTLLAGVRDVDSMARATGGNFDSAIRNRALLLLATLDAAPSDPRIPALVERLSRDASDAWWSTQECSFTLLALGQFIKGQHATATYSGSVYVDDKLLGKFTSTTATFRGIRGTGAVRVVMDGGYAPGAAYYSLVAHGVKTAAAFRPEANGIRVTRELRTREGKPVDASGVQQGDLVVCVLKVESTNGAMGNVVVQNLIPAGLEVENPRLATTERLPWITGASDCTNVDIRDDQLLYFVELPPSGALTFYSLLRAVTPGVYAEQPLFAEAMYSRANHAIGERGSFIVRKR